jgi:hypothetical protein
MNERKITDLFDFDCRGILFWNVRDGKLENRSGRAQRVGGNVLFLGLGFVPPLPLSSDPLGGGQSALFRFMLGEMNNVTESPVKFLLQLREIPPRRGNQTAFLQSGLASLYGSEVL